VLHTFDSNEKHLRCSSPVLALLPIAPDPGAILFSPGRAVIRRLRLLRGNVAVYDDCPENMFKYNFRIDTPGNTVNVSGVFLKNERRQIPTFGRASDIQHLTVQFECFFGLFDATSMNSGESTLIDSKTHCEFSETSVQTDVL
jgi:hypothetical protein